MSPTSYDFRIVLAEASMRCYNGVWQMVWAQAGASDEFCASMRSTDPSTLLGPPRGVGQLDDWALVHYLMLHPLAVRSPEMQLLHCSADIQT
jgi:hypothetical protein